MPKTKSEVINISATIKCSISDGIILSVDFSGVEAFAIQLKSDPTAKPAKVKPW